LAWVNFRWLRRALDALVRASTAQEGREKPKVPRKHYLVALFRYGLLGLTVYVIFIDLHVPLGSMILGFCALAAAAMVASMWEILHPVHRRMPEHVTWLTQFVNHHLGHFALALLAAFNIQPSHPELPIPDHVVMAFVVVILGTILALVLRSQLSVENPGAMQQVADMMLTN